jgi:hypothetical protein
MRRVLRSLISLVFSVVVPRHARYSAIVSRAPMNVERVDLLIQYALAIAAQNEWDERELGPIHLLKYVYLADLAHAARNGGETFTGADWRFYKFGPWSNAVHERIRPTIQRLHVNERTFAFAGSGGEDGEGVRWRLDSPDQLVEDIERKIPATLASAVRKYVREFAGNTSDLLHFVYRTEPMMQAAPNETLSFAYAVPQPEPQFEKPTALTENQKKKLRQAMRSLKERLQAQAKPRYVKADPAPIYDETFEQGVKSLDRDGGDELLAVEGEVTFSDEMWKSRSRHDGGPP